MSTFIWGLLILSLSVLLAVGGLVLVQRLVPLSLRESHNTAIGIIYAALYVMFGVMVGFSAYLVLNKYVASQNAAENEVGNVEELYWIAGQFSEPKRDQTQQLATSYARAVVDEEWPLMSQGRASPRAGLGIDTILFTYFVGMKTAWLHVVVVAALAAGIALILFAIGVLDNPFGTDFRVGPYAFEMALNTIEGSGGQ